MAELISFQEAIQQTEGKKRHLILGNGFSIACRPDIFRYDTLFNQADFSESAQAKELFNILDTHDFEEVKFKNLYVGLYGNIEDAANQLIIQKVDALKSERSSRNPLEVHYYDASTAKVWGD